MVEWKAVSMDSQWAGKLEMSMVDLLVSHWADQKACLLADWRAASKAGQMAPQRASMKAALLAAWMVEWMVCRKVG